MQSQYNCGTVTAGVNFKRDAEEGAGHRDVNECEGSAVVPILSQLNGAGLDAFSSALTEHLGADFLYMVIPEHRKRCSNDSRNTLGLVSLSVRIFRGC
jgi:sphingomyelin phosphodiesterase